MHSKIKKKEYVLFLNRLKEEIVSAKQKACRDVNKHLVEAYLFIGKAIYEKVELSKWGEGIVVTLSKDLRIAFPSMKGFSRENLWRMKKMYETYKDYPKLSPVVTELSWSNNLLILFQAKSMEEKEFYLKLSLQEGWSRRELERQISSFLYERFMFSKSKKIDKTIIFKRRKNFNIQFKDEYIFDFLSLGEDFCETDLRKAIVRDLKQFFLEFGRHLAFERGL